MNLKKMGPRAGARLLTEVTCKTGTFRSLYSHALLILAEAQKSIGARTKVKLNIPK